MTEITVTVVVRGARAPADAIRLTNIALTMPGEVEVRLTKKED